MKNIIYNVLIVIKMGLFKSDDEKQKEEQELIKRYEALILKYNDYTGKVGATHSGWNFIDGFRNADKTKFKTTKFKIFDEKLIIERNKMVIEFSNIKEIFQDENIANEAMILLNNDKAIAIRSDYNSKNSICRFKAFLNILNKFIGDNNIQSTTSNNHVKSEDKFDKLIKLGDMYDNGLLSDEEFALLKDELLSENNQDTTNAYEKDVETPNICENCGTKINSDDIFCCECGTRVN